MFQVSPKYTVVHWERLNLSKNEAWQVAIDIFEDRFRGRFLQIMNAFERLPHAGFAVLALDCLLIETLQQFRMGAKETPPRKAEELFVGFMTETSFKTAFTPEMARIFYRHVRCGILHQAEVKQTSRLRGSGPIVLLTGKKRGVIVNHRSFHRLLLRVFQEYVDGLRAGNDATLRKNFVAKMDSICQLIKETESPGPVMIKRGLRRKASDLISVR